MPKHSANQHPTKETKAQLFEPVVSAPQEIKQTQEPVLPTAETIRFPNPAPEEPPKPPPSHPSGVSADKPTSIEPPQPQPKTSQTPPTKPVVEPVKTPPAPLAEPSQKTPISNQNIIQKLLSKARAKIQEHRQKRLDKILAALAQKNKLTNKDIRKIIKKSRWTVQRYMDILENQGQVLQKGKQGKGVYYQLK